jgi:hypothetical protein
VAAVQRKGQNAATDIVFCTFNDADGTSLDAYSWLNPGDVRPGPAQWVESIGDWTCQGGWANCLYIEIATINAGVADCQISVTLRLAGGSSNLVRGIVARSSGDAYFIIGYQQSSNKFGIWEYPSVTERASVVLAGWPGDSEIVVQLNGQQISGTLNGGNLVSYSSAVNQAATVHGFSSREVLNFYNDFRVWSL